MKILLTIQSVLNYLYNNIIDLIWVKKIRFNDNSEMTTSAFKLFDIKSMSEYKPTKCWCCISDTQPKRLSRTQVPIAYNYLKNLYDNVDNEFSDWSSVSIYNSNTSTSFVTIVGSNVLIAGNNKVRVAPKMTIKNTSTYTELLSVGANHTLTLGKNTFAIKYLSNSIYYFKIYKKDTLEEIATISDIYNRNVMYCNGFYFYYGTSTNLVKINENGEYITTYLVPSVGGRYTNVNDENEYVIWSSSQKVNEITKIFDFEGHNFIVQFHNGNYNAPYATFQLKGLNGDDTEIHYVATQYNPILCKLNDGLLRVKKLTNIDDYNRAGDRFEITLDKGLTYSDYGTPFVPSGLQNATALYTALQEEEHGYTISYTLVNSANVIQGYSCLYTSNFNGYMEIANTQMRTSIDGKNLVTSNGSFACYIDNSDIRLLDVSAPNLSKKVYIDTINGINIKYYKNEYWKICTPDIDIDNDTNLQSVYEYLGYLNYWWIDTSNEQITLQRNSNLWSMMFVGDDYIDLVLPQGSYVAHALKSELNNIIPIQAGNNGKFLSTDGTNILWATIDLSNYKQKAETVEIDTPSINIDNIQANKNYIFSNANITDITITACETSMEETTIQFTTGSSAPTLTDNSGLVWFSGIPTLQANTTYVIVIFNKQAFYQEQGI